MVIKDRYELVECVARGGMGQVWRARDLQLDGRVVAIKLLRDHHDAADRAASRVRLEREIRTLARLRHTHIVGVLDQGEHDGEPFIAMEFVEGETVASAIQRKAPLSLDARLQIIQELCEGLHHAHEEGVVHRDIKPGNLIIASVTGALKIVDFGLARSGDASISREGALVGSLNYMSPEQVRGFPPLDHRTDIFAVGAVFYELLTARKAFPGNLNDGLFTRIAETEPEPLDASLPTSVTTVVARALQKRPEDRYQDISEMAREIRQIRASLALMEVQATTVPVAVADPHVLEQRLQIARLRMQDGDLSEAAALVASVLQATPTSEAALALQATLAEADAAAVRDARPTRARSWRRRAAYAIGAGGVAAAAVLALTLRTGAPPAVDPTSDVQPVPPPLTSSLTEQPTSLTQTVDDAGADDAPADASANDEVVEPVPVAQGLLTIDALPWAEIVAVRDAQGRTVSSGDYTPIALTLPAGRYTVSLQRGGLTKTEPVAVDGGAVASLRVEFAAVDIDAYFTRSTAP